MVPLSSGNTGQGALVPTLKQPGEWGDRSRRVENIDKKANFVSSGGSTSGSGKHWVMKGEEYEYKPPALLAFGQLVCSPLGRPSTPPSSLECLRFSGKGTNAILLILLGGRTVTVACFFSKYITSPSPSNGVYLAIWGNITILFSSIGNFANCGRSTCK